MSRRRSGYHRTSRRPQPGSRCLWPGCGVPCKAGRIMDPPHWQRIPRRLRDAYITARADDADSPATRKALAAIVDEARRQDLESQEAGAA